MRLLNIYKQNILAFWLSIFYVLLGGVVACSLYPRDLLNGDWWFYGWIVTLPVNFISFSYRAAISMEYFPVLIIQIVMFVPTFIIISKMLRNRKQKKAK